MYFIVDAHLPKLIVSLIEDAGHDAIHTSHLIQGNATSDTDIITWAMRHEGIVITKDADFYNSYVLHKQPSKLVMVKVGNMRLAELRALFENHIDDILRHLITHDLVEIYKDAIIVY